MGVEIERMHSVYDTWMSLFHRGTKIKSGRKTANINTKKLDVFSLLRPIVQ